MASNGPLARRRRPRPRRGVSASQSRLLGAGGRAGRAGARRRVPALDNAKVALKLTLPGGDTLAIDAEPDAREAGMYSATYVPKRQGAYRVLATATAPDGTAVGDREAGWAAQPAADEFARLQPDREFLKAIARKTGGEVVDGDNLASFVASLPPQGTHHRAVDFSIVAPPHLFLDRNHLPGRRMGPAPG